MLWYYAEQVTDASLDVAVSHALLRDAASGGGQWVRLWHPPPALSFGRVDLLLDGAGQAIAAARVAGLTPVKRLAGGRAAAVGPSTLAVGWASPAARVQPLERRYEVIAGIVLQALNSLGVTARIGELDGEWCPGSWSILVGNGKVGGLAQRVVRGGAWVEGVVVLGGSRQLASALAEVQSALGRPWSPSTLTALEDTHPHLTTTAVADAMRSALAARWQLMATDLSLELIADARRLRARHDLTRWPTALTPDRK